MTQDQETIISCSKMQLVNIEKSRNSYAIIIAMHPSGREIEAGMYRDEEKAKKTISILSEFLGSSNTPSENGVFLIPEEEKE